MKYSASLQKKHQTIHQSNPKNKSAKSINGSAKIPKPLIDLASKKHEKQLQKSC
ncbi:MAG: hypothetical protein LBK06_06860 [Planctomycetaceae bacterium]|jgi:hypothetical protein|nr:hypothetical protein [Planctomycetaceae bacterium]